MKLTFPCLLICMLLTACYGDIKVDKLYGKWKYVRVQNPNSNPPDSVTQAELEIMSPSITFSRPDKLVIVWGGKTLSSGKFRMDNNMIRYREDLPDGKIREFPFLITKFNDSTLVFETMVQDKSSVEAKKMD